MVSTWRQAAGGQPVVHAASGAVIRFRPAREVGEDVPPVGTRTLPIGGEPWIGAPEALVPGVEPRAWPRLMRVAGEMWYLYRRLALSGEIEIIPGESRVTARPGMIQIEADDEGLDHDLAALYARAALGERDPLLVTAWSRAGAGAQEMEWLAEFWALRSPLESAWAYGLMRRRAQDIYALEIAEIIALARAATNSPEGALIVPDDPALRRDTLALLSIVHEDTGNRARLTLAAPEETRRPWTRYTTDLLAYARREPDAELYCHLADAAMTPYTARIVDDRGTRVYALEARR